LLNGQTTGYKGPRMPDGHPNLNGIYQAVNTANWNLQDHPAYAGPMWELGAIAAVPSGKGVVVGNDIPYKPEAAAKLKENFKNRRTEDPEAKCYMPGIPRANYMPYPFQIVQTSKDILFVYEFATSNRLVNMGKPMEAPSDTWMGTNNGHWEGDTLVIDTVDIAPAAPLAISEAAGLPNNGDMHVIERIHLAEKDILHDDLEIIAPHIFTKPWKTTRIFFRQRARKFDIVEGVCATGDLVERVNADGDHIFVPVQKSEWGHTTAVPAK
jgi:hypothetical protein